jgi:two-component system chemotaxis response regulator CheY
MFAKFNILIVDDDSTMLDVFECYLEDEFPGHINACRANNGVEALRKISNEKYDLIITDNNMPKLEGLDFIKVLKEDLAKTDFNLSTPVILISGGLKEIHVAEATSMGVKLILAKPVDPVRFRNTIRSVLTKV